LPDGLHGEEVVAVVVARDDAPRDGAAIVAWSQEHLAKYKYPREVVFVDALPLGGSGKVLKRELRARLARRVATGLPAD
jgi:long-chain acyl-CoA synthetase